MTPDIPCSGTTFPDTSVLVLIPEKHLEVFTSSTTKSSLLMVGSVDEHEPSISLITIIPYCVAVSMEELTVPNKPLEILELKTLVV